jgi:transposase
VHFKISRNTVRNILRAHQSSREGGHDALPPPKLKRASKLDDHLPRIKALIKEFSDITAQRIYEEIKIDGYQGGMSILKEKVREIRPRPKRDPIVRFETDPGVQGQMDWSPYTIDFKRTGRATVLCFSYILGFSRRQYIDFTLDRKFHTLIRRHVDAFQYYGGVPKECLYDGEKTVILRWEAGHPIFNPKFVVFITHYRNRPRACKPRSPRTKGKIEAPFRYVEGNLLNGRHFQDFEDLRATARWWLCEKSDRHRHDTTGRPPIELFLEREQAALQPLPLCPYDTCEVKLVLGYPDGFVRFDTNLYSVPYEYVGEILTLKASETEIFIYSPHLKLIGFHERRPLGAGDKKEDPEHRKSKKVKYGLEPVREQFLAVGDGAEAFLAGLKDKYPRNCGFQARYILLLKESYHCEDINRALIHASSYDAFDGKAVERILGARAKRRTLESIRDERASEILRNSLPKISQRPLDDYNEQFLSDQEEDHDR